MVTTARAGTAAGIVPMAFIGRTSTSTMQDRSNRSASSCACHPNGCPRDSRSPATIFDGPACAQVLDRVRYSLQPGTIVVNTSTIAPAEAEALASGLGAAYVHAPLLGSLPAVANGTLEILASADNGTLARVRTAAAHPVHPGAPGRWPGRRR
jgi:hypothetical protein